MSQGLEPRPRSDIAIIGLACVFPGARNAQQFWENIIHKVDAVSDPPPEWEAEFFFDPENKTNDRTYCKHGGYLGKLAEFNPMEYGVMPNAVDGTEPDHFMALRAASEALADAGYGDPAKLKDLRHRTEVIIGRGTYVNRGNTTAIQHSVVLDSVLRVLKQLHPEHTADELAEIRKALKSSLPPFHADTAPGLVPNIISGRIANRLDLMGPNYIVDAACASSLIAVDLAVNDLHGGRCDMALAGGVHASTPPTILTIFSQLKALSRKGQIRPFDRDADGTLLGEGVGMVVLKRLEDAEQAGDQVYAVIKGAGTASDGRALGLLAPRLEGEEMALRRAYEAACVDPESIELVEAHGTATLVGDAVEMEALNNVFGLRRGDIPRCALGSVKSMISHTMPASGMASLIKTALALHHKVLPPTLHCENPNPKLELEKSNFYLNTETRPWIHGSRQTPRRAGVNAFGFGGINAHTVLEEYTGPHPAPSFQHDWDSEMFVLSGETRPEMLQEAERLLEFVSSFSGELSLKNLAWTGHARPLQPVRLAIVAASREDLQQKLARAIEKLRDERTARIRAIEGIYYFSKPLGWDSPPALLGAGKVALVFPGEGAQYSNMLADLAMHFPEVRESFDLMDRAFEGHPRGYLPSSTIFPPPDPRGAGTSAREGRLYTMDAGAEAVFAANQALYALIEKLGIPADAMVGHSTGEHSALLAAGVVRAGDERELIRHIRGVNGVFEELKNSADIPQGVLLAVAGADHALLEKLVAESDELHIALDNCPHQVVICGPEPAIDGMMQALAGKAAICQKLPFARAYHTPWFEVFSRPLRRYFDTAAIGTPKVTLYSCVTAAPYPEDPDEIRHLCSIGWARTVRFRETIQAMHQDGVRIFVEVGPRGNLTGFIDDILRGKAYTAVPANVQHRSGILQLQHMLAQLVAHGVPVRLAHLYEHRDPTPLQQTKSKPALTILGGLHPVRLPRDFALPRPVGQASQPVQDTAAPVGQASQPVQGPPSVIQQHFQTMTQFLDVQNQVMSAYLARRKGIPAAPLAPSPSRPLAPPPPFPFITEVLELTPGVRARARHRFSLDRERLFTHHTLGRNISREDPELAGLPVVPLTIFMEILAEAAALLQPGQVLVGMRDFRAYRWITLEEPGVTIELTAEQQGAPSGPGGVYVTMRESGSDNVLRPIWAEGLMLFAPQYPQPGPPHPVTLENQRHSRWTPDRLYVDGMFHGPTFQAVKTIERTGDNGTTSTIEVLPRNAMFAGISQPLFLTDAVVLDAAGQVVAFWSQEQLDPTGDIFPYRLTSLDCFGPPPEAGARVECRVAVTHVSDKEIHSDIEIVGAHGRLLYRIGKWEDRRFPQTPEFWQLRVAPQESRLSNLWNEPIAAFRRAPSGHGPLVCCRLDGFSREFFEASHGIWLKVLAHLALSRREREEWLSMRAVDKRPHEWLLGRCVAKDAVRLLLEKHLGVQLSPADVEIVPDAYGRLLAEGPWARRLGIQPAISVSQSQDAAVALAALDPGQLVGIDLESLSQQREGFEATAFNPEERHMLDAMRQDLRQEWALRMWCAKEAVAKALGRGLRGGQQAFHITSAEMDTGVVEVELRDGALDQFPHLRGRPMIAYTAREADFVFSTIIYQQGAVQ